MMNNIKCLDYESEATEMFRLISFKMPVVGENTYISYSKCLIEILIHILYEAGREMEESLRAQRLRGTQKGHGARGSQKGPNTPHWRGPWRAP